MKSGSTDPAFRISIVNLCASHKGPVWHKTHVASIFVWTHPTELVHPSTEHLTSLRQYCTQSAPQHAISILVRHSLQNPTNPHLSSSPRFVQYPQASVVSRTGFLHPLHGVGGILCSWQQIEGGAFTELE